MIETTSTTTKETPPADFNSAVGAELQKRVLATGDMISSANTGIESAIQGAITKTQEATSKGTAAVESAYNRQIGYTQEQNQSQMTAARERGVGVNTSDIAYKQMASEADKQIKDLEMRKNELMLQNDAAGASKVSDLMLQTLKMKNDAMQQTFQNLMSMSNFGLQAAQEGRAVKAQNFAEKSAMTDIALRYGISVLPGETMESIAKRASVSDVAKTQGKQAQADLAKTISETKRANADAQKALSSGDVDSFLKDPGTSSIIEDIYRTVDGKSIVEKNTKTLAGLGTIRGGAIEKESAEARDFMASQASSGKTIDDIDNVVTMFNEDLKRRGYEPKSSAMIYEVAKTVLPKGKASEPNWFDKLSKKITNEMKSPETKAKEAKAKQEEYNKSIRDKVLNR